MNTSVRQRTAQTVITSHEENGAEAGCIANAGRGYRTGHNTHSVVDAQTSIHSPTRRVDVDVDLTLAVFRGQEQQLCDNQACHSLFYWTVDHDNALFQQPRENVIGAFSTSCCLDDSWYEQG